jgi:serine/threonine-protein kinase RsbW
MMVRRQNEPGSSPDLEMSWMEARIANRPEQLDVIAAMVRQFGALHALSKAQLRDLDLALDEALTNIIAYGYDGAERGEIVVRLSCSPTELSAEIEDTGRAFDPTQVPPPNLSLPPGERTIGGLGIHLVRSLMDDVSYMRTQGKNRLQLRKRLTAP